mmetsp:Transcript_67854/g.201953  ORF Transcript_67854/g.201953 Transcript_67854/m.201953 type:complete len:221 (-) Transcript_67854:626-1288(-)
MEGRDNVHVQALPDKGDAIPAAVAIVDAEEGAVPPVGRCEVLEEDVLVLHGRPEALFRVDRCVEAEHLELQGADAEEVVRLQPVALALAEPDPALLRRLDRALAEVHIVPPEGVAHAQPLALLPAGHRYGADCDVLRRAREAALRVEVVVELVLRLAVRSQSDGAPLPADGGRWRLRRARRRLGRRPELEDQGVRREGARGPHLLELRQGGVQGCRLLGR